jgi:hypothetical protein
MRSQLEAIIKIWVKKFWKMLLLEDFILVLSNKIMQDSVLFFRCDFIFQKKIHQNRYIRYTLQYISDNKLM